LDPVTLQYITLHVTNCSSCGPEDGLQLTETCRPVNFILNTLGKVKLLFKHNGMDSSKIKPKNNGNNDNERVLTIFVP
jgi:hypothetical protein